MTPEPRPERHARLLLLRRLGHVERKLDKLPPAEAQDEDEQRFEVIEERVKKVEQRVTGLDHVLAEYRRAEAVK